MEAFVGILLLALLPVNREPPLRPGDVVKVHVPHKGMTHFVIVDMGWGWMLEMRDGTQWNMHDLRRCRWQKVTNREWKAE